MRILDFHKLGLHRVSRVIDGNMNYDALMEHRLIDTDMDLLDGNLDIHTRRRNAFSMFQARINKAPYKIILPTYSRLACEGATHNNLREFAFFERICPQTNAKLSENNYSTCRKIAHSELSDEHKLALDRIISDVNDFYESRADINASLVRQQVLYSRSFFGFLISFSNRDAIKPIALIQANDHSPVRVALSMVMKGLGVPRVYLQHAEVTQHFPQLDFEYSILRNEQSRETYASIGPLSGKVYVIPRFEDEFSRDKLSVARTNEVTVVIYPTSRIDSDGLRRVLAALAKNESVLKVLIKQHPGAAQALDKLIDGSGAILVDDIPPDEHVALVGNSSIVVELLHRGIPVYQNFSFDPVQSDYYGFVSAKVTFNVELKDLTQPFWRPYLIDDAWLDAYVRWDPTARAAHREQQSEFCQEIQCLLSPPVNSRTQPTFAPTIDRIKRKVKGAARRGLIKLVCANQATFSRVANFLLVNTDIRVSNRARKAIALETQQKASTFRPNLTDESLALIKHTLCNIDRPAEWILLNDSTQTFTAINLIKAIEDILLIRHPALNRIFDGFTNWPPNSSIGTWIYLRKSELGNIPVSPTELSAISKFVYEHDGNDPVTSALERTLLSVVLRTGSLEQLEQFWASASVVDKDKLSINRQLDVIRKIRNTSGRELEAESTQKYYMKRATPFHRLKFVNMDALDGRPVQGWNHEEAEKQFVLSAPDGIVSEFISYVQPVYDCLRTRMRFMNVRTDRSENSAFLTLVQSAIENRKPFSLIRLSDGEGYLFPKELFFSKTDAHNRERHWWGIELSQDLRSTIIGEARQAILNADIVGIPTVYRFIRDHSDRSTSLTKSVQGRGLLEVLNGVTDVISSRTLIAEDKVNVALFRDIETVTKLAQHARKCIIVTSVRPEHIPLAFQKCRDLHLIIIPTHYKTNLNEKYYCNSNPLPFLYNSLLQELDELAAPGDLVLVAGGIIGKIFIGRARENGAVALDIGHTFDDWIHARMPSMR